MDPESGMLSESVLFKARKATSPSSYYSSRIRQKMREIERGTSEKDAEIEASKTHWTEVESVSYYTAPASGSMESSTSETGGESSGVEMTAVESAKLYEENRNEMLLLMENEESDFFQIGGEVVGEMIAEGGQASIYEYWVDRNGLSLPFVLKVFKAGYRVSDLRTQWPLDVLQRKEGGNDSGYWNPIYAGQLLDDGRFAFRMLRFWGDLRKLLDVTMQHNGNRYAPFMRKDGSYQEFLILLLWLSIASGMHGLHDEDILHRDLKASNVLIESTNFFNDFKEVNRFNPTEYNLETIKCFVADYECSIGVCGTGYWRAPEILKAVKNRTLDSPNVFTQKGDVYSYAMTCYEILTGFEPFEHPEDEGTDVDIVLEGKRPTLPQDLNPWVIDMFQKCWHENPSKRPTFSQIKKILKKTGEDNRIFGNDHALEM